MLPDRRGLRKGLVLAASGLAILILTYNLLITSSDIPPTQEIETENVRITYHKVMSTHTPPIENPKKIISSQNYKLVEQLITDGEKKWQNMLGRQSQTLEQAVTEYRRRYKREPPRGFEMWFEFAQSQNHTLVDEYDELMLAIEPFLALRPGIARWRAHIVTLVPHRTDTMIVGGTDQKDVIKVDPDGSDGKPSIRVEGLVAMLSPVRQQLASLNIPEFRIPVNAVPEPRVVPGDWDTAVMRAETIQDTKVLANEIWQNHKTGERSMIEALVKACGPNSRFAQEAGRTSFEQNEKELHKTLMEQKWKTPPPMLEDVDKAMDVCDTPELIQKHGIFRTAFSSMKGLFPLLSYGRPSAFGDIPIPSVYQWTFSPYYSHKPEEDHEWSKKQDNVYWIGEPSGGGKGDKSYGSMHRHRMVAFANPPDDVGAIRMGDGYVAPAQARSLTDITFVPMIVNGCKLFGCELPDIGFPFAPARRFFHEAWRHKLVIDADGWGPSGRWRALMQSNSLPVRSTIYHEWFTDRMVPWVHYLPLSPGFEDLWEVFGWALGSGKPVKGGGTRMYGDFGVGDNSDAPSRDRRIKGHEEAVKKIALASTEWVNTHMRKEDMSVYSFRMLLEVNRVINGLDWVYNPATLQAEKEAAAKAAVENEAKAKEAAAAAAEAAEKAKKEAEEAEEKAKEAEAKAEKAAAEAKEAAAAEAEVEAEAETEAAETEAEAETEAGGEDGAKKQTGDLQSRMLRGGKKSS